MPLMPKPSVICAFNIRSCAPRAATQVTASSGMRWSLASVAMCKQLFHAFASNRRNDAELGQVGPDGIDHRGLLADKSWRGWSIRQLCCSGVLVSTNRMLALVTCLKLPAGPLSEDAVRAGVTGHHVRYVLFFGLAGVILAFIGLAIYFGFDELQQRSSEAFARDPSTLIRNLVPYAAVIIAAGVAAVLLLALWNMVAGRGDSTSQMGMRFRVVAQFVIICAIMAMFYLVVR